MTQSNDVPQTFLQEFFGDGNAIRWDQYESGSSTDPVRTLLEPWVRRFLMKRSPFLLPRVNPASTLTTWYVLCTDPREARSVRESLQAFIGPTYAEFNGELATLDPADPIESLCGTTYGSLVFRLKVKNTNDRTQVGKLLNTLVEYHDRESSRSLAVIKPIGRLLRDLEMAILANNEQSAWTVYSDIRNRGRLSAINLAFLKVRIHSAFERWAELLLMPNLDDLLQVRRPKRISELIAEAVYRHHFLRYEATSDATGAVDHHKANGLRFQNLVRSTDGFRSAYAIKFALVAAVASNPPKREIAEQLTQHDVFATETAWADALLNTLPSVESTSTNKEAAAADDVADLRFNENDFDKALALYLIQPHTAHSVCRVLETAVEVDTQKAATDALAYLSAASEDIRAYILGRRVCTNNLEILSRVLGQNSDGEPKQISSLSEWFENVDQEDVTEGICEVLEYGIMDWISNSSFDATILADQLRTTRIGRPAEIVRNAVPTFIRELLLERTPSRQFVPVYKALVDLLIYDETIGPDDAVAVEQLTESILTTAPSHVTGANDFVDAVEVTTFLWDSIASPRNVDWVLSMLDLLIDTGAQQHTNLSPILASIIDSTRSWTRRVSDDQWSFLELLASDLDLSEMVTDLRPKVPDSAEKEKVDIRGLLAGKSIAVYSLTERIARRFGQLAEQAFDGIKLHYVHDKALTDRMKSLAHSADIFIVNTWDAKHAATNGIKDNRTASQTTLQPHAKSANSLFACLMDCVLTLMHTGIQM